MNKDEAREWESDRKMQALITLYETLSGYQNHKENWIWLAFSFYITSTFAILGWVLSKPEILSTVSVRVLLTVLLSVFSLLGILLVRHQNWLKAWAVEREHRVRRMMERFEEKDKPSYAEIAHAAFPAGKEPAKPVKADIIRRHAKMGIWIVRVMLAIAILEVTLLALFLWILPLLRCSLFRFACPFWLMR